MTAILDAPSLERLNGKAVTVPAPNLRIFEARIIGTAPYMQHAFFKKGEIESKQREGGASKNKRARKPREFEVEYEASKHTSTDGWVGIPASSFRNALISACRIVGFAMTKAKLSIFCVADGEDLRDGQGLVRIYGEPEQSIMYTRNETGVVDLRARPMWRQWHAVVRLRYDADQFTETDVMNLLLRAGLQVGLGEGRPDSKKSAGMGYGTFTVEGAE